MLQFSATKSPFAKRFGLKAFFFGVCWNSHFLLCCHTGYHAQMYSTARSVHVCIGLCRRTSGWKRASLQERKKKRRILPPAILLLWDTILWVTRIIKVFLLNVMSLCQWVRVRRRRGSRTPAALKGRQQGLEGAWQSQWAGIQYRMVCLFSGSFITSYAIDHTLLGWDWCHSPNRLT